MQELGFTTKGFEIHGVKSYIPKTAEDPESTVICDLTRKDSYQDSCHRDAYNKLLYFPYVEAALTRPGSWGMLQHHSNTSSAQYY